MSEATIDVRPGDVGGAAPPRTSSLAPVVDEHGWRLCSPELLVGLQG